MECTILTSTHYLFQIVFEYLLYDETFDNPSSEYSTAISSDEALQTPTCSTDEDTAEHRHATRSNKF